jgi:hypothetical protein
MCRNDIFLALFLDSQNHVPAHIEFAWTKQKSLGISSQLSGCLHCRCITKHFGNGALCNRKGMVTRTPAGGIKPTAVTAWNEWREGTKCGDHCIWQF